MRSRIRTVQKTQLLRCAHSYSMEGYPPQLFVGLSVLLLVIISLLLMTIIWLYPQRFERDARQLQLTQGTVLKRSQRIQTKRVQLLTVIQPLLARGFGHFSLIFHSFANSQEQKSKFVLLGQTAIDIDQQLQAQQLLALSDIQQLPLQRYLPVYFQCLRSKVLHPFSQGSAIIKQHFKAVSVRLHHIFSKMVNGYQPDRIY